MSRVVKTCGVLNDIGNLTTGYGSIQVDNKQSNDEYTIPIIDR